MGLIISANGIIQSSAPRNVVSQITADVLALMDARYFTADHAIGSTINQVTVHGNQKTDYRYLRASTNTNNPNPPKLDTDVSLRFDLTNSLRTNTYEDIASDFTFVHVVKLDAASISGVFFRIGDATDATTSKTLYFNATNKTVSLRQNLTIIATDTISLDKYIPIIVSCSANKTSLLINNMIIDGPAISNKNRYYQLMSADDPNRPVGNLKYFSMYKGAASYDEMFKLQQILKQNFSL
ncbi:hypothetical protein [Acinetobacter sp. A47]|uniref:hypothetical protein n=1 Tax=Acinetobacter sp. A47 TaxID=1561217 RepID=UPI00056E13BE|nr:hypothetical protein [Acinetobacter sp. A47]